MHNGNKYSIEAELTPLPHSTMILPEHQDGPRWLWVG